MRRRQLLSFSAAGLAVLCLPVLAQRPSKVLRIGFLAADSSSTRIYEGFRQGMRDLGYVEGNNFSIQWRYADGDYERLPMLAAELVRQNVDVLVAGTTRSVQAARQATAAIPIIMVAVPGALRTEGPVRGIRN